MDELVIARRFRGPSGSGNGGYTCGKVAACVDARAVQVTLRVPPPLDRSLSVERAGASVEVLDKGTLVAEAKPVCLELEPPRAVSVEEARAAAERGAGAEEHPFPECFVCGPSRREGDALRLRPGRVGEERLVAATWVPDGSLSDSSGVVEPPFVWAALDCPGAFAVELVGRDTRVLGRLVARIDRLPRAGEETVVVGWPLGGEGRRQDAGTALLSVGGDVLAVARAVWIEPRPRA